MPVEIREVIIKATVALDWDNKTITNTDENIVCLKLHDEKKIALYVKEYFNLQKSKTIVFTQAKLSAFLVEWQSSQLK